MCPMDGALFIQYGICTRLRVNVVHTISSLPGFAINTAWQVDNQQLRNIMVMILSVECYHLGVKVDVTLLLKDIESFRCPGA